MLIDKQLEEKVIEMLRAKLASLSPVRFSGAWSYVPAGSVKGEETPEDSISIGVAVGAPVWDQYTVPTCSMPVALAVVIRRETAPDGAALAGIAESIADALQDLQLDAEAVSRSLTSENFDANGVRLDGGPAPTFVRTTNVWRFTRSFTVRGVVHKSEEV
jgi:hypothetical protein